MLFGMPTLIETESPEACGALCRKLDLDFIELNMNLPQYQVPQINMDQLKEVAEKYGIFYTIHLDENLNISDFNPYIAEGYRRTVAETIDLAKRIGCPILNMHLSEGVYFTLPDQRIYLFSQYREQYLQSMVDFRTMCETAIGDSGMKLCIENSSGFLEFQKEAVELLLESPVFGLTFDIGHNRSIGGADEAFILQKKQRLCPRHMHDALGEKNIMVLGSGEVVGYKYFSLAEEAACRIVLETKTVDGLKQSVAWLRASELMR